MSDFTTVERRLGAIDVVTGMQLALSLELESANSAGERAMVSRLSHALTKIHTAIRVAHALDVPRPTAWSAVGDIERELGVGNPTPNGRARLAEDLARHTTPPYMAMLERAQRRGMLEQGPSDFDTGAQ